MAAASTTSLASCARTASLTSSSNHDEDKSALPGQAAEVESSGSTTGQDITPETIAHAERLAGVSYTPAERALIAQTIGDQIGMIEQRVRNLDMPDTLYPAMIFNPILPGQSLRPVTTSGNPDDLPATNRPLPSDSVEIAHASIAELSHWIRSKQITSRELTALYLARLKKHDQDLKCVVTLMEASAMKQADRADRELGNGRYRGPLHGIPWGAKDLLDTAGTRTTWGASTSKNRTPRSTAAVIKRLEDAGAVLVAKLSLGALAYGDIWYGGRTNNPWNLDEGSSGSSAGSAAATASGLVGFSLGTETCGSIISPSLRCGTVGLRPTFGRVPRDGAMALCWSLDKIGPIVRHVDDAAPILAAINGASPGDPSSVTQPLHCDASANARGLRVGYNPAWFSDDETGRIEMKAVAALRAAGAELVEITLPDWPWDALFMILLSEASAAFESLTRSNRDDELAWQEPEAWPNTFRQSWFIPGPELVQVDRFRRQCMEHFASVFDSIDAIIAPSFAQGLIISMNCTGHPSLTVPVDLKESGSPHGVTMIGRLFDEGTLLRLGRSIETSCWRTRPRHPLSRKMA
ncbi:MAG: amidase [Phycisphaerales bacterium]|nr:amidase [Phycisphaerales bacterium]